MTQQCHLCSPVIKSVTLMEAAEVAVFYPFLEELSIGTFQGASHHHRVLPRHQSSLHMIALPSQMMSGAADSLLSSHIPFCLISASQKLDF